MKAILVIDTDAKHIEDLYIETMWNDDFPVNLGEEIHFKPMPNEISTKKITGDDQASLMERCYIYGWNDCIREILNDRSHQE